MEDFGQHKRLRFEWRVLTLAKDADYPEENQDVFRVDDERGVAAIADGVSSSLFARQWARILVEAALEGLPDPDDRQALARWLAEHRAAWSRQIDVFHDERIRPAGLMHANRLNHRPPLSRLRRPREKAAKRENSTPSRPEPPLR